MNEKSKNFIFCLVFGRPFMLTKWLECAQPENFLKFKKIGDQIWTDSRAIDFYVSLIQREN